MKEQNRLRQLYTVRYDCLDRTRMYLEQMAAEGWMFADYTGHWMLFEKCEPKTLHFAVELFEKSSVYDTFCNEENIEYIKLWEQAGWKHVISYGNLQFFYSENAESSPIETEDAVKLKTIWKSIQASTLFTNITCPLLCAFNLIPLFLFRPLEIFDTFTMASAALGWIVLLVVGITNYLRASAWKKSCEKSIADGTGFLPRKVLSHRTDRLITCAFLGLWCILGIWAKLVLKDPFGYVISCICLFVIAWMLVPAGLKILLQKKNVSPQINLAISIAVPSALLVGFVILLGFSITGLWSDSSELLLYTREVNGNAVVITRPEELSEDADSHYDLLTLWDERFLLTHREGLQRPCMTEADATRPSGVRMHYIYYHTGLGGLRRFILNSGKKGKYVFNGLEYDFDGAGEPETKQVAGRTIQVYLATQENTLYPYEYLFVGKKGILKLRMDHPIAEDSYEVIAEKVK